MTASRSPRACFSDHASRSATVPDNACTTPSRACRHDCSSPSARERARCGQPSASTARLAASATPRSDSQSPTRSGLTGPKRTRWARERTVGSRSAGRSLTRMKTVWTGGSSKVLSSALAASAFIASAGSRITRRSRAWKGCSTSWESSSRACRTEMIRVVRSGSTPTVITSGCWPTAIWRQDQQVPHGTVRPPPRSGGPSQLTNMANQRALAALPTPPGPSKTRQGCSRPAWASAARRPRTASLPGGSSNGSLVVDAVTVRLYPARCHHGVMVRGVRGTGAWGVPPRRVSPGPLEVLCCCSSPCHCPVGPGPPPPGTTPTRWPRTAPFSKAPPTSWALATTRWTANSGCYLPPSRNSRWARCWVPARYRQRLASTPPTRARPPLRPTSPHSTRSTTCRASTPRLSVTPSTERSAPWASATTCRPARRPAVCKP